MEQSNLYVFQVSDDRQHLHRIARNHTILAWKPLWGIQNAKKLPPHENVDQAIEVIVHQGALVSTKHKFYTGGDVLDCMGKHESYFTESGIKHVFKQMVSAVHHFHTHKFSHNDVSLENFVFVHDPVNTKADKQHVVLIDSDNAMSTAVTNVSFYMGKVHYIPSDQFRRSPVSGLLAFDGVWQDIHALGACLFAMFSRFHMFVEKGDDFHSHLLTNGVKHHLDYLCKTYNMNRTDPALLFAEEILCHKLKTTEEILKHSYFTQ